MALSITSRRSRITWPKGCISTRSLEPCRFLSRKGPAGLVCSTSCGRALPLRSLRVDITPTGLAFGHPYRLIDGRVLNLLQQTAGPANFQRIHLLALTQPEMLLERQTPKTAAVRHFPQLPRFAAPKRDSRAIAVPVAPDAGQTDIQIVAGQFLRAVNGRHQQIARITSAGRDDDRHPAIAEEVGAIGSVALSRERQTRSERSIAELPRAV